jgi:hypothetical protein
MNVRHCIGTGHTYIVSGLEAEVAEVADWIEHHCDIARPVLRPGLGPRYYSFVTRLTKEEHIVEFVLRWVG